MIRSTAPVVTLQTHCNNHFHPRRAPEAHRRAVTVMGSQRSGDGASDTRSAIAEYASKGPLLAQCGFRATDILDRPDRWIELGDYLCDSMSLSGWDVLSEAQKIRVYHYYLPVFFYVEHQLAAHRQHIQSDGSPERPLVFGISAPQGCGKSTLVEQLVNLLEHTGRSAANISIDDFYLTFQDQQKLAADNPGNPLLQLRGNAGSHDLQLGHSTLEALVRATSSDSQVPIPRYDKSQQAGRGDRAPQSEWPTASGKVDVVLFEGWMLGFRPLASDQVVQVDPNLQPVNRLLTDYVEQWDSFVDAWLVLKIADPSYVYKWRLQAETAMRAQGKPGMTDEQVADFVDRYMPAYKAYLPSLYAQGPSTAKPGHVLVVELDRQRSPVQRQIPADVSARPSGQKGSRIPLYVSVAWFAIWATVYSGGFDVST